MTIQLLNLFDSFVFWLTSISFCGSRPTAVNLSDAATKLGDLVRNTSETTTEVKTVFKVTTQITFLYSIFYLQLLH